MDMFNPGFLRGHAGSDEEVTGYTFPPFPLKHHTEDFEWDNPDYRKSWEMTVRNPAAAIFLISSTSVESPEMPADVRRL
jgi:hypothetical protein